MSEQERRFSQLSSDEQTALSAFYKETLEVNFRESRNAAWELAKVLLTVNSGAAAGLFLVVRSSDENIFLPVAFYSFCFGVFFVVAAYFVGAVQFAGSALKWEEDIQKVLQNEISTSSLIRRQRERVRGKWSKACGILGLISFLCLAIGGVTAGFFFTPLKSAHQKQLPLSNILNLTNSKPQTTTLP